MANFAETLTYWYLRLNGFFPIVDYVLHSNEGVIEHSTDADILAVRFPFVYEEIGGLAHDWDNETFLNWGVNLETDTVGLIVEVTTSQSSDEDIRNKFSERRLTYCLKRFGLWERNRVRRICDDLAGESLYKENVTNKIVGKLFVTDQSSVLEKSERLNFLPLDLRQAEAFVRNRMETYSQKHRDRVYFPDDLIQYMAWLSGRP